MPCLFTYCLLAFLFFHAVPAGGNTILSAEGARQSIVSVEATKKNALQKSYRFKKGAGVIINEHGFIATNLHTVVGMSNILVTFSDGSKESAQIESVQSDFDLALLRIRSPRPLTPIPFANPETIQLGTDIIHIGQSYWLQGTLSGGKIVGLGKNKHTQRLDIFEINLDVYKGDSGGPVLNTKGELLGLLTAKRHNKHKSSFAVPAYKIQHLFP